MRLRPSFLLIAVLAISGTAFADIPRPEHPRPDFQRPDWVNLSGEWEFDFDPQDKGVREEWFAPGKHAFSQRIVVPYPWESELSGIKRPDYRGVAWYHRKTAAPTGMRGKRIFIIFGAVDWRADVWVDGRKLGSHENGYIPFEIDLTQVLGDGKEHDLIVRAEDRVDPETPTGKQTGWYTPTSGIWQTVYLEGRGSNYIQSIKMYPDADAGTVRIDAVVSDSSPTARLLVQSPTGEFEATSRPVQNGVASVTLKPKQLTLWSPNSPYLYHVTIGLLSGRNQVDTVKSYFAIRKIQTGKWKDQDFESVLLNGKPIYIQAALHQSFNPKGIYTYPSEEAIRKDLQLTREVGLNSLRVHIKVEEPLFYYWADKLGVLIWYDLPNFSWHSETARRNYEQTLRAAIARDFNHPSIFVWVDFNETWGLAGRNGYDQANQDWVHSMYRLTKELDPTRLAEDNSPCNYDHVATDLNTWHFYINDYGAARKHIDNVVAQTYPGSPFNYVKGAAQIGRPLLNSEYGGISAGSGDQDISYCLHYLTNLLRQHNRIQGFIYTELSDIEWEHNGLVNYDRSRKEFGYPIFPAYGRAQVRDIFNPDFLVIEGPPIRNVRPGQRITLPVSISHYSEVEIKTPRLSGIWGGTTTFGEHAIELGAAFERSEGISVKPYTVVEQQPLELTIPEKPGIYVFKLMLLDADRQVTRNWVWFNAVASPSPRVELFDEETVALRFSPEPTAFSGETLDLSPRATASGKYAGYGEGWVEYRIRIPEFINPRDIDAIEYMLELAPKARDEKLDWPARKKAADNPQTDGKKFPTSVAILMNGAVAGEYILTDDAADYRGILSHQKQQHPGSYGELRKGGIDYEGNEDAWDILFRDQAVTLRIEYGPVSGKPSGGLAVFGETNGAYPVDPTIFVHLMKEVKIPEGYDPTRPLTEVAKPVFRALLPSVGFGEAEWKYTLDPPGQNWAAPDFDDSAWKTGQHGFGRAGTPKAQINTPWETDDIWLRWKGELKPLAADAPVWLDAYYNDDVGIFVNGKLLLRKQGPVGEYETVRLTEKQRSLLQEGENTIAVHCTQRGGGQFIDVGLFTK
jgi:hypothetical protein